MVGNISTVSLTIVSWSVVQFTCCVLAGVYLVKQVLRSKHRIRLYDYEMNNLHKLKLRLAKDWRGIANKAEMDVK